MSEVENFFEKEPIEVPVPYDKEANKRQKARANAQKYRTAKLIEDKDHFNKKQKEYREKNKDKYNYMLARYYFRKLTPEMRTRLLNETV